MILGAFWHLSNTTSACQSAASTLLTVSRLQTITPPSCSTVGRQFRWAISSAFGKIGGPSAFVPIPITEGFNTSYFQNYNGPVSDPDNDAIDPQN